MFLTRGRVMPGVLAVLLLAPPVAAQDAGLAELLGAFDFREMGPATMGGRISDLAIHRSAPSTWYVGLATGGVWKTRNEGSSWTPLWDAQPCPSIGAVTVAPSNPNVIWVGTGEPQNRQSSPWGCGVFRSVDGGRTWTDLGLRDTRHVSRIMVHPTDPDVAWVAAVGHLWGPNEERGVYRTTDGGQTWEKVLYVDASTGAIDLASDRSDPNTLFAATYSRRRTAFGFSASGGGGGIWRSLDGGDTWERLSEGLPVGEIGRVGLDVYDGDSDLVYATVEASGDASGLYRSRDRGASWEKVSSNNPRPMYFSLVRIDPSDPDRIYLGGTSLSVSDDGGATWWEGNAAENIHVDHHALWIDPSNPDHLVLGDDGGLAVSLDGARTWRAITNMAIGQFYEVDVDERDPYWICGGLQDNGNWCAPSHSLDGFGVVNADWIPIHTGDGFHNHPDPFDPDYVYTESQGGNLARVHVPTGQQQDMRPVARTDDEDEQYRYNWNTPIVVSRHTPGTLYVGANHLLRSRDYGITWEEASPDLTKDLDRDTLEIFGRPLSEEHLSRNDGVGAYGTITAAAESPLDPDVLWVGTDDGNLQVTRDGGATWANVVKGVPGLPPRTYVNRVEPSSHVLGRVYVAFDGHRKDDYAAYVYTSDDFGENWRRITEGLPAWSVNVVREHPRTPALLFAGNEIGLYVSFDRGGRWHRLEGDLPTVPVDDLRIQERENDLVVATHGRSVWILPDLAPLEAQARTNVVAEAVHLFEPERATKWSIAFAWPFQGDYFAGENPPWGAVLRYWLRDDVTATGAVATQAEADDGGASGAEPAAAAPVRLVISDAAGAVVRTLEAAATAGLHSVVWDLRRDAPGEAATGDDAEDQEGEGRFGGGADGPLVAAGRYTVRLEAGDEAAVADVLVRVDPRVSPARATLAARQDALLDVSALAGSLSAARRRAGELETHLDELRALVSDADGEHAALLERIDTVAARLEGVGETLDEHGRVGGVASSIEETFARPTADQLWRIDRAWEEVPGAIERLNALLSAEIPALHRELDRLGIRHDPGDLVAVPRRPGR